MAKFKRLLALVLVVCMVCGMLPAITAAAEDAAPVGNFMEITSGSNRYLSTVGSNAFNVFMYDNTFSGTFGDQHMSGIEFSLNGTRIATNGDMHMLPTPEQWDATPAPSRGTRVYDTATNTITVPMTFSGATDGTLKYDLVAASTDKGFTLSMVLRSDMPESLKGKARFNLEFLPGVYESKSYQADLNGDGVYDSFGYFPMHAQDAMVHVERPNLPSQAWYVKDWNEQRGDAQPVPFATGYGFSFAPEDENYHISIQSMTDDQLELLDGRNRAQNGWYVLSTLISATKNGELAAQWDIVPDVEDGWVRDPNVSFSQVGYAPQQEKFAVIELDKWDENYPKTASLYRLNADGSEEKVLEKELPASLTSWMRFKYGRFDFSEIEEVGMYRIHYGDYVGEPFPIATSVYDNIWQTTLSGFLAVQMDHIAVREGYKIWHGASHMDDAYLTPNSQSGWYQGKSGWFDGMSTGSVPAALTQRGLVSDTPVEGLNKGGWFDAGDFDLQMSRNFSVLSQVIQAALYCGEMDGYDDLAVEWNDATGGTVEMHRPDGVPDVVQQAIHGSKQVLAEYEVLGGAGGTMETRYLRQYTHLGDPSSDTDGWIYDPTLGEDEVVERDGKVYSGVCDDRYMLLNGFSTSMKSRAPDFASVAYLAAKYNKVDPSYGEYAVEIFNAAVKIWNDENMGSSNTFNTNVSYYLAAKTLAEQGLKYEDYEGKYNLAYFKDRVDAGMEAALNGSITSNMALLALLPYEDDEFRAKLAAKAGSAVSVSVNTQPYGVNFTTGASWGGSPGIYNGSSNKNMCFLYYNFPEECEKYEQNILRSVNYILGCHPVTNSSWISGIGAKSALHPYNSNRAEESYIPGSILPGHITFSDYPETMGDFFNFLWFENESIIDYQSNWLPVGIAASKIAHNDEVKSIAATKDFESSYDAKLVSVNNGRDGYFSDDGFDIFMYSTTFSGVFGDQHSAAVELVQNGRRIATNGDIRLLPTPEQWDSSQPASKRDARTFEENKITVDMTLPEETFTDGTPTNPAVEYQIIAEPEEGGIKLTLKLDEKLPTDLVGYAGFNMEFLPAVFMEKSFMADSDGDGTYDSFGVFPRDPRSDMEEVHRARTNNQYWYVQEWNEMRGDYQPKPFATGTKMTFAAEDDDYRIRIECEDGFGLYDGRNRAQNGWYVLRTLIPADKTEIVWHISPDTDNGWTREPNISHSQVGYEPELEKVATIELDPNYKGGNTATLKRVNDDGSYTDVLTKELTAYANEDGSLKLWQRYNYKYFDFSEIKARGTYVIDYDGFVCDPFPIDKGVYKNIWAQSLSTYLAIQMDHMRIREGYKIWRNAAHMDDALQVPMGVSYFDGQSSTRGTYVDAETELCASGYKAYEHIPGLDIGGYCDAGDFDIQLGSNLSVISDLALAYQIYGEDYDTLDIDENTRNVELHRPDEIPDLVELAMHGALQIMGQLDATAAKLGDENAFLASVIEVPTLRQYTHLGDGAKDTDGYIYDASLEEDEVYGRKAGNRDDRLAFFTSKSASNNRSAASALAATADILKGYDDETAARCLEWAEKIWAVDGNNDFGVALNLFKATGKDEYKKVLTDAFDTQTNSSNFTRNGYKLVLVLDQLGDVYKTKFETALKAVADKINTNGYNANNPYHVSNSSAGWGNAASVASSATIVSILHKYYPDIIGTEPIYRAINYVLGNHPYNATSYVSGVGYKSVRQGYGSNRADNYYIAGGVAPGYCTLAPDLPEHMDDFNFLWFENEYTVTQATSWILATLAADDYAREADQPCEHEYSKKVTEPTCTKDGYTTFFCEKCFESYQGDVVPALGHDYEVIAVKEPTCTKGGNSTFVCTRCGDKYVGAETEALGHEYKNGICIRCGRAIKATVSYEEAETIEAGKQYVVVAAIADGTGYAMTDGDAITGTPVDISGNAIISEVSDDMIWTFNEGASTTCGDYTVGYNLTAGNSDGVLARGSSGGGSSAPVGTATYTLDTINTKDYYGYWIVKDLEDGFKSLFLFSNKSSSEFCFALRGGETGFDAPSGRQSNLESLQTGNPLKLYEVVEVAAPAGGYYLANEIEADKQYVVVAKTENGYYAMADGETIAAVEAEVAGDQLVSEVSEEMLWTFLEGTSTHAGDAVGYYLTTDGEQVLARGSGGGTLYTNDTVESLGDSHDYYGYWMVKDLDEEGAKGLYAGNMGSSYSSAYILSSDGATFKGTSQRISGLNEALANYPIYLFEYEGGSTPIVPEPCKHDYKAVVTAPTCLEGGFTTYTCGICGDSYVADETAVLGHNFKDGVCTRCGAKDPTYNPDEPVGDSKYDIVFMSDLHNGVGGYLGLKQMVTELKNENLAPKTISHGGDYVEDDQGGKPDWQTQVYDVISGTEKAAFPTAKQVYTMGNHDWESGTFGGASDKEAAFKAMFGFDRTGMSYADDEYEIYMIGAQGTTGSGGGGESFIDADIEAFDKYLASKVGSGKVIFLQTHWPAHSSYNFKQRVVGNADKMIDTINKYADDLDVVWIWGHNHYEDSMRYEILKPGDQIMYKADTSGSSWGNPRNPQYKTIKFTYANAGCMNDMWYLHSGRNNTSASNNYRGPAACLSVAVDSGKITFTYNRIQEVDGTWTFSHDANITIHNHNVTLEHPSTVVVARGSDEPIHVHDYKAVVTAPTCTEKGYTTYICECGESYVGDEVKALGHDYVDGVCTRCGAVKPTAGEGFYVLADEIEADKQYVVVAVTDNGYYAMVNGDTIGAEKVEVSGSQIVSAVSDDMIWDFAEGVSTHAGDRPGFFLSNGDSGVLARGSGGGTLNTNSTVEDLGTSHDYYGYWMISELEDGNMALYAGNMGSSYSSAYILHTDGTTFSGASQRISSLDTGLAANPMMLFEFVPGGATTYVEADTVEVGKKYVVVGNGYAMTNGASITGTAVTVEGDKITSEVSDDMIWLFSEGASTTCGDYTTGYYLTSGDSGILARGSSGGSRVAPLSTTTYTTENIGASGKDYYAYWIVKDQADGNKSMFLFSNKSSSEYVFAMRGGETFDAPGNSQSNIDTLLSENQVKLYEVVEGGAPVIRERPEIADITVNGESFGFDPATKIYNFEVDKNSTKAPVIAAVAANKSTEIEIEQLDGPFGTATVKAVVGKKSVSYSLSFNYGPEDDYFADGDMSDNWTILHEVKDPTEDRPWTYYRFEEGTGLVLPTQKGSIYMAKQADSKGPWTNVFTMPAQGDWEIVVKSFYPQLPKDIYQQTQVFAWQDEDHYIRINCQYNAQQNLRVEPANEVGSGTFNILEVTYANPNPDGTATLYYKVNKTGTTYTVSYSTDCKNWVNGGSVSGLNYVDPKFGLFCTQDDGNDNWIELSFEYVAVTSHNGVQKRTDAEVLSWAAQQAADYMAAGLPAKTAEALSVKAPHGYSVEFVSSNSKVIAADGTVTAADKDTTVQVAVKVTEGDASATSAPVTITVPGTGSGACDHDYKAVVTAPTCTANGYTTYTCTKCGDSYTADFVTALGHNYVDGFCTRCGAADPTYVPGDASEAVKAAQAAAAAAADAQKAAEEAAAIAETDAAAAEAAKKAAQAAKSAAEFAQAAAESAKAAAEAADADASAKAAAAAKDAAAAAASAAEAAKAQAAAAAAKAKAEAAMRAALEAQAKADAAAAEGDAAATEAETAQAAADRAKEAARDAADAADLAAAAAEKSNAAAAQAAAAAAADAAKVADALKQVASAQAELADAVKKAQQDSADAEAARKAAEEAQAAAEAALAKAEASKLNAAKFNAQTQIALAAINGRIAPEDVAAILALIDAAKSVEAVDEILKAAIKDEPAVVCPSEAYADAPAKGNWAHEGIDFCIAKGYMNGVSEFVFKPQGTVTRAQLVTILYRVAGEPKFEVPAKFEDVAAGKWYSDAIAWAAENGVVKGVSETKFAPDDAITREQIAAILFRYSKAAAVDADLSAYPDADKVSNYAKEAVAWAVKEGLINGIKTADATILAPKDNATRAQIASIIMRFLDGSYDCK